MNEKLIKISIPDIPILISVKNRTLDCILDNWVFENFILAAEPFSKVLQIFETCVSAKILFLVQ